MSKGRTYQLFTKSYYILMVIMAFIVLILLILNLLIIAKTLAKILLNFVNIENKRVLDELIADILTFFVLIELTRAFTEYLAYHRVRLSLMAEIASIFILREILIKLYVGEYDWITLIAFSILLLSVVFIRVICLKYSPKE
ncbi:phosphate-starvation-inducible PsiE family protein [Archaeoglobus sp.]